MKQFKVFYSWQSDLPGNKTKWFINECIKEAVENCNLVVEGIEIVADRDTQGKTGSPNIMQTIFEKIDECDLFIADVSIVNGYGIRQEDFTEDDAVKRDYGTANVLLMDSKKKQIKYTPNPNVLIELGYAVRCLGWEKVICFLNADFGRIEQLPFDLDHQRVTSYSLDDDKNGMRNKKECRERVKKELRGIIVDTILELANQGGRPKKGKAYHIIGTYNPDNKRIDADLVAYDVTRNCRIDEYNEKHKNKAIELIHRIKEYQLTISDEGHNLEWLKEDIQEDPIKNLQKILSFKDDDNMISCRISDSDQDEIKELAHKYLDISEGYFDKSFFNLGNLRIQRVTPVNPLVGRREPLKKELMMKKRSMRR
ncbi:hypothetical protein SAMN02745229_03795 [Butyrivibrio fibrisolvens DSM 3071]|uniref:CD-NTase-associated protein 12/Pycsar effector protein TIR domain-containing protein n=1 Tax=Butyrivibrio fibrisolvens DSM 3071 TaxID=1121131 RepID=A0A1M6EU97_BUTFI|nr:hypothetical protein [Butyrivibrio fibrisolvens]SHI89061.1 hypothetical protein SAMN02745229_03795 [Butyrivibrio fibrisolvens DSM 3071]